MVLSSLLFKELRLVVVAGCVDFCRVGLTYESSRISATLGDVRLDVGNLENKRLSTVVDMGSMKLGLFPHAKAHGS